MRVLLVNPEFPESYWNGRRALPFSGRLSLLPPLGLITVAALLPRAWRYRLIDLNIECLRDEDILGADVVMTTGMLVQRRSLHEVLARCRRLGVRSVVGGPYATALPHELHAADHLVLGEAEEIASTLATDLAAGRAQPVYRETARPDVTLTPTPRYDLLRRDAYYHMSLQYSRGCPFNCEFCDIIVMYGRKPRTKTAAQVIAELNAIRATGFAGDVFFVDDNFIGNKRAVRELLPEVAAWRKRTRAPLEFYTEASMNLADDLPLVDLMTAAGFTAVFTGIETPSEEALRETRKVQNLNRDIVVQVHRLMERGLDVWAGFILGFDSDGPEIFERMISLVQRAGIAYAMVGILEALPNTPLHHRLQAEGRLRNIVRGDQFGLTNVITKMPATEMLAGYRRVMETLYDPATFFDRCRENLMHWRPAPGATRPLSLSDFRNAGRALIGQGLRGPYRGAYRNFLAWVTRNHPGMLGRAVAKAASGHHFILYTRDLVVPEILGQERALAREPARPRHQAVETAGAAAVRAA